jgi:hypothetical protein
MAPSVIAPVAGLAVPPDRSTALIDEGITVVDDPDDAEREVWASRR